MTEPIADADGRELTVAKRVNPATGAIEQVVVMGADRPWERVLRLSPQAAQALALRLVGVVIEHDVTGGTRETPESTYELENVDMSIDASPFVPGIGLQARAIGLYDAAVNDTPECPQFERVLIDYCRDLNREQNSPAAVWATVAYGVGLAIARMGRGHAATQIRRDLNRARKEAREAFEEGQE